MSRIKKALISIIMMVILTSIFSTISNAKSWGIDPKDSDFNAEHINVGDTMSLTHDWAVNHKDLFCVVYAQQFGAEKKYRAVSIINIEGLNATNTHGKTIKSHLNGYLAWILNNSDGKGGFGTGGDKAQRWIWNFIGTWMEKVGYNFNIKHKYEGIWKGFTNKPGLNGGSNYYTSWKNGAKAYVQNLRKSKVLKDKTKDGIKVEKYGKDKLKIGPFNYEFGGKLDEFVLYDENGKTVKDVSFVVKNGSKDKKVKLSKIKTGKNFYAVIPINSGVSSIGKVKVTNKYEYIYAKVVFWRYTGNSEKDVDYQNVIQFVTDTKPETITKEWNKDIPLLINISGKVWEDIHDAKGNTYAAYGENTYKEGDKLLQGITVRLKDNDGNTIIKETLTGENGEYRFTDIEISNLKNYYVEFEYNGLTYTSVRPLAENDSANDSKATEVVAERKTLNKKFTEITNAGDINNRSHGYTRGEDGSKTGTVTYENDTTHFFSTMGELEYDTNSEDPKWAYTKGGYEDMNDLNLTANTKKNNDIGYDGYSLYDQFTSGNYSDGEIKNVNLGLRKREQPRMSISNDIESVRIDLNNYSHTYLYEQRKSNVKDNSAFNVGVKFEEKYVSSYTRAIYPSDIQYSSTDAEESNKLKVYVTYVTTIRNLSTSLKMTVNELVNYYDARYTIVNSWLEDNTDNKVTWTNPKDEVETKRKSKYEQEYADGKFYASYTQSLAGEKINPAENKKIHIEFQVSDEAVLGLLNNSTTLDNTLEVFSYSSYYGSNSNIEGQKVDDIYAGIDSASAPGNAKIELDSNNNNKLIKTTYEADTDSAPSLLLEAKGVRTIEGTVFEDETDEQLQSGKERKGNGIYEDKKENIVSGVTVDLLTSEGVKAIIYPYASDENGKPVANTNGEEASTKTGTDGHYIFKGIEPGTYFIRYTYSNGTTKVFDMNGKEVKDITVQNYKSTIITSNTIKQAFENNDANQTWYKDNGTRYSDARDDYDTRMTFDENGELKDGIDKEIATIDANTGKEGYAHNSINADTPILSLGVEYETIYTASTGDYYEYKVSDIDFGIVERPRQHATLVKEISNIKVTLQEGKVLVDGDPREGLDYVTVTGDSIFVTVDTEYLQGAHIEVKYDLTLTNSSEVDYISENYYNYGIISEDDKKVTFTRAALVDYVDKEYVLKAGENGNWEVIGNADTLATEGFNWDLTDEEKEQLLNNFSTIVQAEPVSKDDELEPGQSVTSTIVVEKLLSPSDKELSYDNSGEVVTIGKNGGSSLYQEKPGTYAKVLAGKPENTDLTPEENLDDPEPIVPEQLIKADAPTLVIIPPTGSTNNNVLYAIIGVISLSVLGAGTYGVRRFLKK